MRPRRKASLPLGEPILEPILPVTPVGPTVKIGDVCVISQGHTTSNGHVLDRGQPVVVESFDSEQGLLLVSPVSNANIETNGVCYAVPREAVSPTSNSSSRGPCSPTDVSSEDPDGGGTGECGSDMGSVDIEGRESRSASGKKKSFRQWLASRAQLRKGGFSLTDDCITKGNGSLVTMMGFGSTKSLDTSISPSRENSISFDTSGGDAPLKDKLTLEHLDPGHLAVTEVSVFTYDTDTVLPSPSSSNSSPLPSVKSPKPRVMSTKRLGQLFKSSSDAGETRGDRPKMAHPKKSQRSNSVDTGACSSGGASGVASPPALNSMVQQLQMSAEEPESSEVSKKEPTPAEIAERLTESEKEKLLRKRGFVLDELLTTEQVYVENLGQLVHGYLEEFKKGEMVLPEALEKYTVVFGNVVAIYEFHKSKFHHEIKKRIDNAQSIGDLFAYYNKRLSHLYIVYCYNKPKSETIVADLVHTFFEEMRVKLGHKLWITDLLISPIQRVMKYQLLLKDITSYTRRLGEDTTKLEEAVQVMTEVPRKANDMMSVGCIEGLNLNLTNQGELRLQGVLTVCEPSLDSKYRSRRLFLFEQIIIMSEERPKASELSPPKYIHSHHIMVNKMCLEEIPEDPLTFELRDKSPDKAQSFFIRAGTEHEKRQWVSHLKAMLEHQLKMLQALTNPVKFHGEKGAHLNLDFDALSVGAPTSPAAPPNGKPRNPSTAKSPAATDNNNSGGSGVTKLFSRMIGHHHKPSKASKDSTAVFYRDLDPREVAS